MGVGLKHSHYWEQHPALGNPGRMYGPAKIGRWPFWLNIHVGGPEPEMFLEEFEEDEDELLLLLGLF